MKVYEAIAQTLQALKNCQARVSDVNESNPEHWRDMVRMHQDRIESLAREYLPSGSGFDAGTAVDDVTSKRNRLVLRTSFHHMNDSVDYCGWSSHDVIVTPDLALRFDVRVTGRDVREMKDYIADTFRHALNSDVSE